MYTIYKRYFIDDIGDFEDNYDDKIYEIGNFVTFEDSWKTIMELTNQRGYDIETAIRLLNDYGYTQNVFKVGTGDVYWIGKTK